MGVCLWAILRAARTTLVDHRVGALSFAQPCRSRNRNPVVYVRRQRGCRVLRPLPFRSFPETWASEQLGNSGKGRCRCAAKAAAGRIRREVTHAVL